MIIYQQLEGWSWPTCGLGGWGGSGRWLLPWWRGGEFLFPLTLCWWAPLDSYWFPMVLLASTLVMLVAPISPFALPSNGAKSEGSEHVVQVGGKTADKGAVFTVSNGQLPGERGSGGWAFQPLFRRVKIQSGFTGLLQFLDRLLWVRRSQKELCSTTSPMKISRLAASGPESGQ